VQTISASKRLERASRRLVQTDKSRRLVQTISADDKVFFFCKGAEHTSARRGGLCLCTARARAQQPPPPPPEAARPALMSRAAHAVESKAVVRIEVAVSPRFRLFGSKGAVRGPGRARGCARALAAVRGGAGKQSDWWSVFRLLSRIGKGGSIAAANCSLD
jgi:hypothetical protein